MEPKLNLEIAALACLKTHLIDPAIPTVDLARALQAHLTTYHQTQQDLCDKLGLPHKRPYYNQALRLLTLSPEVLDTLAGKILSLREIRKLLPDSNGNHNVHTSVNTGEYGVNTDENSGNSENNGVNTGKPGVNTDENSGNSENNGVNTGEPGVNTDENSENSENNGVNTGIPGRNRTVNSVNTPYPSFPLLRDSVNTLSKIIFCWVRDPELELGQVVERWAIRISQLGVLRVWASVAYFGLAVFGAWHLQAVVRPQLRHLWWMVRTGVPTGPSSLAGGMAAGVGSMAAPQPVRLTGSRWIAGHLMELHWTPSGKDSRYRVYWQAEDGSTMRSLGSDVRTPGAIIAVGSVWGKGLLSVTAISPNEEESAPSDRVSFPPNPINEQDRVDPLPTQGVTIPQLASGGQSPSKRAVSAPAPVIILLKPPVELHAAVKTPDLIRLSWRAVGRDVRYNLYSSASRELTALRKENDHPLKSNVVDWTPETGLPRYWVVVTALDPKDQESAYSEAIEVVRHPEKSDSNALTDAAAGMIKRMPW